MWKSALIILALVLVGAGCANSPLASTSDKAEEAYDMATGNAYEAEAIQARIDDLESRISTLELEKFDIEDGLTNVDNKIRGVEYKVNDTQSQVDKIDNWLESETDYPWY
jgi:peptidoglycan hydrolase CwlO-like protein